MINFNKKDSVADAVNGILHQEALKGGQKKIDKNHNNKIDSEDFKILRGEKKVSEEIDVNDRSEDDLGGRKDTKKKDDVGPSSDYKSTKVRFHAGPKNESVEVKLADTKPEAGVVKTEKPETRDVDDLVAKGQRKKLGMKEETRLAKTLKGFKEQYEEHSIYDQMINEVLSKDASAGEWIHDFVHSDNPKFAGKSKEQRKKQALAAYYAKQRNEEVEQVEEGLGDTLKKAAKKAAEVLGGPNDEGHRKDLQKKMGVPQTGQKPVQKEEVEQLDETMTRKHFQQVADVIKAHPDQAKRNELAKHHAGIFKASNPRFDHARFYKAAGAELKEGVELEEGWDDMLKAVKERSGPQPSGGSGVKKGTRYGGSKQKDTPEKDEDKKKVNESKRPETDNVPFVTSESKPLAVAKDLAKKSMKRMKTEMLGKISN